MAADSVDLTAPHPTPSPSQRFPKFPGQRIGTGVSGHKHTQETAPDVRLERTARGEPQGTGRNVRPGLSGGRGRGGSATARPGGRSCSCLGSRAVRKPASTGGYVLGRDTAPKKLSPCPAGGHWILPFHRMLRLRDGKQFV